MGWEVGHQTAHAYHLAHLAIVCEYQTRFLADQRWGLSMT
jgi:hypothetical protein